MEHDQYTLKELQKMFKEEQNLEELNKIMSAITDKHDVLFNENK